MYIWFGQHKIIVVDAIDEPTKKMLKKRGYRYASQSAYAQQKRDWKAAGRRIDEQAAWSDSAGLVHTQPLSEYRKARRLANAAARQIQAANDARGREIAAVPLPDRGALIAAAAPGVRRVVFSWIPADERKATIDAWQAAAQAQGD